MVAPALLVERVSGASALLVAGRQRDRVVVVFSAANANSFTFFKNTEHLECDRLFVRDPNLNAWYQRGFLEDLDLEGSLALLGELLSHYRFTAAVGSSMGGYAAVLCGLKLGMDRILAIGPQTRLTASFSRSPPASVPLVYPTLDSLLESGRAGVLDMAVGTLDPVDYYNVARVCPLTCGRVHVFPGEDHFLPKTLASSGALAEATLALSRDEAIDFSAFDARTDTDFTDLRTAVILEAVPRLFERKEYKRVRALAKEALRNEPNWPLGRYLWAAASLKLGEYEAALSRLAPVAARFPKALDFNSLCAEAALSLGKQEQARAYAMNMLQVRSKLSRPRDIVEGRALPIMAASVALDQPSLEA